jgi:flotillin
MQDFLIRVVDSADVWLPIGGAGLLVVFLIVTVLQHLLYVCPPNQILIFSGRTRRTRDGHTVGFRVVFGGRALRVPILEKIERMDMTTISVPMSVSGAYSKGSDSTLGIPLSVHAVANIKVSSNPAIVGNAIERFLGQGRDEIARVAKETLEGHLRGVLAGMTPEEVNEDRLKFAHQLSEEAERDLEKLGLQVDTLKIQHVSDGRQYLESIGRTRIAEVVRAAEIAESDAERAAREAEAAATARAEVAHTRAHAAVLQKENELRQIKADLDAEARSEEERAIAAASAARAEAEKTLQEIRGTLEQLRLEAEVTIPAAAERKVKELEAAGKAASIAEDGRAQAAALDEVAQAWRDTGGKAMDMFVLQNLDEIFGRVADAARKIKVREVNLIDSGDGSTLPAYVSAYPATVATLMAELTRSLGVDIRGVITGNGQQPVGAETSNPSPVPPAAPAASAPSAASGSEPGGQSW